MSAAPVLAKELLAFAAHGVLIGLGPKLVAEARAASERTTILTHGYLARGHVLIPMRRYLAPRIPGDVHIFDYRGGPDVPKIADELDRFIRKVAPNGRVDLVGHSLGGLIARYWVQELGGADRACHCITLATPHHGTESARLWPFSAGRDLIPGAPFLRRLAEREHALGKVQLTCITAAFDLMVRPRELAELSGRPMHRLPNIGHNGLLFSPRVFRILERVLADRGEVSGS